MNEPAAVVLTELQLDALTELVNLGVSNAALSLRQMVREEIILSVPEVSVVTASEAVANLSSPEIRRLVAIHQNFEGDICGRALLIFPEARSMELVRSVIGEDLSLEEIVELEHDALAEIGNVLLNSCLCTIANGLERSLRISLPEVIHGEGADFFGGGVHEDDFKNVLFIYINFAVRLRNIQGYIAMLMDFPSQAALQSLLIAFIERTTGKSADLDA